MENYKQLIRKVLDEGEWESNRTAEKSLSLTGEMLSYNCSVTLPLLTLRRLPFDSILAELLGFLRGASSAAEFRALGTGIWDANANENAQWLANAHRRGTDDLGRIYGVQWLDWIVNDDGRTYSVIDQIHNLLEGIRKEPTSRRHIVTAWNPAEIDKMALPPCHILFQCHVRPNGNIDMTMYQRSADLYLGVPFNIASYAILLNIIAYSTGYHPGKLTLFFGNVHLYESQIEASQTLIERSAPELPILQLYNWKADGMDSQDLAELTRDNFGLDGYAPLAPIPGVKMVV